MTYQTQQLTTEFEKQSQYIICLLAELQQKDSAFLSLEAELQHCKQEFELFKSQREEEENNMTFEGDGQQILMGQQEGSQEAFEGYHSEEKQGTVTCDHDRLTPISDNETSWSDVPHLRPVKMDRVQRRHDREGLESSQGRATADLTGELLKHQDKLQSQIPKSVTLLCMAEPRSLRWPRDITAKDNLQIERICDQEQGDLEREDEAIEGELQVACELEINRLQEQVCNLFPLDESFPLQTCFCSFPN